MSCCCCCCPPSCSYIIHSIRIWHLRYEPRFKFPYCCYLALLKNRPFVVSSLYLFLFPYRSTSLRWWLTPEFFFLWAFAGLEYQSSAQGRGKSSDSGGIYNSTSHEPRRFNSQVIGDGLTAPPPGRALMSAALSTSRDTVAEATGVGWVSIRHGIPAKPASSHRAISKNLPLCANNSTDVLAFWRSFAPPKPALFVRCPGSQPSLAFPLPRERRSWNQPRYCHPPPPKGLSDWRLTGFRIGWDRERGGCG